ncbi:lactosylceramide 4-alpha-galactosyltransferase-like [Portunus trituberculatus]|uniref:lactosylceramide 4-alpha-galactosyltransferase-like n=1 Tax=Portunus trituberculatus TaxID=210409 RepID=UPI001E1CCFFA|nr:lactosylceramide 4-alpha-galactosyltransferase-like [Portunus trituberculatus]
MRGVIIISKRFCMLLMLMLAVGSILTFHYSYNKYLANLQDATIRLVQQGPKLHQDGGTQSSSWWRDVVCKQEQNKTDEGEKTRPLKRLFKDVMPEENRNVFLMDTACNPTPKFRVWCSVESWAQQNPERHVWFLLTSGRLEGNAGLISTLLHQYTNLQVVTADLDDMFRNTPLLSLFNGRKWTETWPVELLSDMLRVLVLWWWGGVYSDTDVISVQSLTLPDNSLGFEHSKQLGSAFYSFQARHPVLLSLMKDMHRNFKPHHWGSIGPLAITRVMQNICKSRMMKLVRKAPVTCRGNVTLFPQSTFYPVRYNEFEYYFLPGFGNKFNETFSRAFALHFWNKMSKNHQVEVNRNSVYEVVAKRFCPITYRVATAESDIF